MLVHYSSDRLCTEKGSRHIDVEDSFERLVCIRGGVFSSGDSGASDQATDGTGRDLSGLVHGSSDTGWGGHIARDVIECSTHRGSEFDQNVCGGVSFIPYKFIAWL